MAETGVGVGSLKEDLGHDYVQSLDRGLAVIRCFSAQTPTLTLSEIAERTGLTRATARRLLLTLQGLGYLRAQGRAFALTSQVLGLGYAYLSSLGIGELAEQPMRELVGTVEESSAVSVLEGTDIVYIARIPTSRLMTVWAGVGSRLPAYPTSMGRVLLAGLEQDRLDDYLDRIEPQKLTRHTVTDTHELRKIVTRVRTQGWALVDQEYELGVRSVAAPLKTRSGATIAALNVSAHAGRVSTTDLRRRIQPLVRQTAAEISALLTHH